MLTSLYSARTRRDADGFTLIELLVVVIIIGLLAAIALPIFIDQTRTSVDASVKADVRNTVTNVVNAQAQATTFPASAKAAISDANTSIALVAVTTEVATKGSTTSTLGNVPKLGESYSVSGWNPNGKAYLGTADTNKGAFAFNSTTGLFTQASGAAPVAGSGGADADGGGGTGSTGGSSQTAPTFVSSTTLPTAPTNTYYTTLISTTGSPKPAITVVSSTLPNTLSFKDNGDGTATISGTPTADTTGSITLRASNGVGSPATSTFNLTVRNATVYSQNFDSTQAGFGYRPGGWTPSSGTNANCYGANSVVSNQAYYSDAFSKTYAANASANSTNYLQNYYCQSSWFMKSNTISLPAGTYTASAYLSAIHDSVTQTSMSIAGSTVTGPTGGYKWATASTTFTLSAQTNVQFTFTSTSPSVPQNGLNIDDVKIVAQ